MTFQQLANKIGIHLFDLIPDEEIARELRHVELFHCYFTDDLVTEGLLSYDLKTVKPYPVYKIESNNND